MSINIGDKVRPTAEASRPLDGAWGAEGVVTAVEGGCITVEFEKPLAGRRDWTCCDFEVEAVTKRYPTLADELSLKPSTKRVLAHMRRSGSITVLEALAAYGTARIAPAIHDLRKAGFDIETVSKKDAAGHEYARYVLNEPTAKKRKAA